VIAIGSVFSALPAVVVALRVYTRLCVTRHGLFIDDWLMLAAFFLTLGMGIMLIVGRSLSAVPLKLTSYTRSLLINIDSYPCCLGAALDGLTQPTPQGWAPGDYFWVTDNAVIITEKAPTPLANLS